MQLGNIQIDDMTITDDEVAITVNGETFTKSTADFAAGVLGSSAPTSDSLFERVQMSLNIEQIDPDNRQDAIDFVLGRTYKG